MPELVNTNEHRVVVRVGGERIRLRAGEVRSVEGEVADALDAVEGVETATQEHKDAWNARIGVPGTFSTPKLLDQATDLALQGRLRGRMATVSVPLNTVVGDNDAPLGPPTGTITTKQAVARLSPQDKHGYSDHERLGEEADNEGLSEIERAQAAAKRDLEELHNEFFEQAKAAGAETINLNPQKSAGGSGVADNAPQAAASEENASAPRRARKQEQKPAEEQKAE